MKKTFLCKAEQIRFSPSVEWIRRKCASQESAGFSDWDGEGLSTSGKLEKEASWAVADPAAVVGSSGNCGAAKIVKACLRMLIGTCPTCQELRLGFVNTSALLGSNRRGRVLPPIAHRVFGKDYLGISLGELL
jgi:hypothetical protein